MQLVIRPSGPKVAAVYIEYACARPSSSPASADLDMFVSIPSPSLSPAFAPIGFAFATAFSTVSSQPPTDIVTDDASSASPACPSSVTAMPLISSSVLPVT